MSYRAASFGVFEYQKNVNIEVEIEKVQVNIKNRNKRILKCWRCHTIFLGSRSLRLND